MNDPRIVAVVSAIAVLFLGYSVFGLSEEAPSTALNTLNWVFFLMALVAFIGSVVQIMKRP